MIKTFEQIKINRENKMETKLEKQANLIKELIKKFLEKSSKIDEFNKQSNRIIKQIEKELGCEMPDIPNLNQLFELGKILEK